MSLVLEGVSKVVGRSTHIYPTDLILQASSLNVLLGATLAGKTSLMRLMAGLDKPSAGRVLWNGKDVTAMPVQQRNVAMVYQQFINYPAMTVYENIASPLRLRGGLKRKQIEQQVNKTAELLRLTPYLKRKPLELSGGQQQRCALARALVKQADLVLLDEPLANLDYKLREELRAEIPRIFSESGAIFVYATTEPTEALLLGGSTATLHEGRITQFAPTLTLYREPQDITTARVFADPPLNFFQVEKRDQQLITTFGTTLATPTGFAHLANGTYSLGFRPHHLSVQRTSSHDFEFLSTVSMVEITGSESYIHVRQADLPWVALVAGVYPLVSGSERTLFVHPSHIYVFDSAGKLVVAPEFNSSAGGA